MNIIFQDWICVLEEGKYSNGRTALSLIDAENGEPVATATINVPDFDIKEDEVIIKDYSENHGMIESLMKANIISAPNKSIKWNWTDLYVCKYLKYNPLSRLFSIKDLPAGTKLMWEAPEPFPGYVKEKGIEVEGYPNKIVYASVISSKKTSNSSLGRHVITKNSGNWMGNESQFLRMPTEEELKRFEFPEDPFK
jgi:hypothetical protein